MPIVRTSAANAADLPAIISAADPNTTIELEDGTYVLTEPIRMNQDGLVLRSVSGNSDKVVIDGQYAVFPMIVIAASDVTLAEITVLHGSIEVDPAKFGRDIRGTRLYGARVIDGGQQLMRVNSGEGVFADDGRIECSLFSITEQGRAQSCSGGTTALYVSAGQSWVVRKNRFQDIRCEDGTAPPFAILFRDGSRDTLVENNLVVDCARGIGFGLETADSLRTYADAPHDGMSLSHYDGIIRNNVIVGDVAEYNTGIELNYAREPLVIHDTIVSTPAATSFFRSIDYRFAETRASIINNFSQSIGARDGAQGTETTNVQTAGFESFVDGLGGDFHLLATATTAIDRGTFAEKAGTDMDGQLHDQGEAPDVGADELTP